MNRYQLIRGFAKHNLAQDYADRLPKEAGAKVVPYKIVEFNKTFRRHERKTIFAVDVLRTYVGGRL